MLKCWTVLPLYTCYHLKVSEQTSMTVHCVYSCPTSNDICRNSINRLDIVSDCYIYNSTKQSPRESMGTGQRRRVMARTSLRRNWQSFLQVDSNKKELFNFLVNHIGKETPPDGEIHAGQQRHNQTRAMHL